MRTFVTGHLRWLAVISLGLVVLGAVAMALLLSGNLQASRPTPTPTPTLTLTISPSPTATPTVTATPSPTPSPTPTSTPSPSTTATPSATATPPPTPTPTAARSLPASMRGVEWYTLPTTRKIVALTFDAGSGDQGLATILSVLASKKVPGTFFLTGQFLQRYPADARAIAAYDMHSIGNHTFDHPYMTQLSDAQQRAEILTAEQLIVSVAGRDPWPLFRFPYGDSNSHTVAIANSLGYGSIRWTVDTLGWEGAKAGQSVQSVTSRALNGARPGEIVLMHVGAAPDGTTLDANALAGIIDGLRARGYGFVAIWDFIYGLS